MHLNYDQSRYLRAADLGEIGSEKRVKIKTVTEERSMVGEKQETSSCVWFTNDEQGLLLNKTNLRTLQGAFGDDMDAWAGKIIVLYSDHGRLPRQDGPAMRVRIPPPKDRLQGAGVASEADAKAADVQMKNVDGFDDPEQLDDDISDVRGEA